MNQKFIFSLLLSIVTFSQDGFSQNINRPPYGGQRRYDGPRVDLRRYDRAPSPYSECRKYESRSGREYSACIFGLEEAERMAYRYAGGHGQIQGYSRGFSWGLYKKTDQFRNDREEYEVGQAIAQRKSDDFDVAYREGLDQATRDGEMAGKSEAISRYRDALNSGSLPTDQIQSISEPSYIGPRNGYTRFYSILSEQQMLEREMRDFENSVRAYRDLDPIYVGDLERRRPGDYWYSNGVYSYESQKWLDSQSAFRLWLDRPIRSRSKYHDLNRPEYRVQAKNSDGTPKVNEKGEPVMITINLQEIFRDSFRDAYRYYAEYFYVNEFYRSLDDGQEDGEVVGVVLGRKLARQQGLVEEFNRLYRRSAEDAYQRKYPESYEDSFYSTYEDYKNNPKLEVKILGFQGDYDNGVLEPNESIAVQFEVKNYGGVGTPVEVWMSGDVVGAKKQSMGNVEALSSQVWTTDYIATLDPRIQNGETARVELNVNNIQGIRQNLSVLKPVQILIQNVNYDLLKGEGSIQVEARNVSTVRSPGLVSASLQISTSPVTRDTKEVGFLEAGQNESVTLSFQGLDPLVLIESGYNAQIQVKMNEELLSEKRIDLKSSNSRYDLSRYYIDLINEYFETRRDQKRIDLVRNKILTTNEKELKEFSDNPWGDRPESTMVGLLSKAKKEVSHLMKFAKEELQRSAKLMWEKRFMLGKGSVFRGPPVRRLRYEDLVKEVATDPKKL